RAFLCLEQLKGIASKRKLRLLAVGCCQHLGMSHLLEEDWRAVGIAEQVADGLISSNVLRSCFTEPPTEETKQKSPAWWAARSKISAASVYQCMAAGYWYRVDLRKLPRKELEALHADIADRHDRLLRDVFGNPFRPVSFDPRWRTSDVLDLARAIYEDKTF